MSLNIVLHEPEIPHNTGNIARTCALTGSKLHIIEPTGFSFEDRYLKRAGLDYWHLINPVVYADFDEFIQVNRPEHLYCATTKSATHYCDVLYTKPVYLLFGKETAGLPEKILKKYSGNLVRVPMISNISARSLNLSNTAAIMVYEVLKQWNFPNMK